MTWKTDSEFWDDDDIAPEPATRQDLPPLSKTTAAEEAAKLLTWARTRVQQIPDQDLPRVLAQARRQIAIDDRIAVEVGLPHDSPIPCWTAEERLTVAVARAANNPEEDD